MSLYEDLKRLRDEATARPWQHGYTEGGGSHLIISNDGRPNEFIVINDDEIATSDAELITKLVNHLDDILKLMEAAIKVRDGYNVYIGTGITALEEALEPFTGSGE